MEHPSPTILTAGLAVLVIVAWSAHPSVRWALLDGSRCLARFPLLWRTPVRFALAYGIFQWIAAAMLAWRSGEWSPAWVIGEFPIGVPGLDEMDWTPTHLIAALGHTAALGNDAVVPFPLSSVIIVWTILFSRQLVVQLFRTARRGFPRAWLAVVLVLISSACAALLKPVIYLFLPEWIAWAPMDGSHAILAAIIVNASALVFEVFVGSYVTVFLMMTAFAWIRGIDADRMRLHILTARRMRYVMKWTLLTAALAVMLITAPGMLGFEQTGIAAYLGILILFFPMQANLAFHNGSLRSAMRSSISLMIKKRAVIIFLAGACGGFLLLAGAQSYLLTMVAGDSQELGVDFLFGVLNAALSGWLLASWVCLFRRLGPDRRPVSF